jgi:hypothetical protein
MPGDDLHANGNEGAFNLLYEGNNGTDPNAPRRNGLVRVTAADKDLTTKLAPGYAVIWNRGDRGGIISGDANINGQVQHLSFPADPSAGHAAVIESVTPDSIVISQTNVRWGGTSVTTMTLHGSDISNDGVGFIP